MHFGRLNSVDGLSLRLPPDSRRTENFLLLPRTGPTKTFIGCPIWAVRDWVGDLYPRGTKPTGFLKSYSTTFKAVEVNSTFYQLLDRNRISRWREETDPGFRFCPKVFRGITENLGVSEMKALVGTFCATISAFEDRLGLAFAQFPETFGPRQGNLLKRFLEVWPTELPLGIEFRHPDWFTQHALLDEAVNLLYRHKVATVITDTPGRRDVLHLSLTHPKVLIRFQGNSGHKTDSDRLKEWAARIKKWREHALEEIYFFTHQPEDKTIPQTAFLALETILGQARPERTSQLDQLEIAGL